MTEQLNAVAKAAVIQLEEQRVAIMARAKNYDPIAGGLRAREIEDTGSTTLTDEAVDYLCLPCRITIDFRSPLHVRRQIETLMSFLVRAQMITQDHRHSEQQQRLDLRTVIKQAADALVYINGKTPTNKKPLKRS